MGEYRAGILDRWALALSEGKLAFWLTYLVGFCVMFAAFAFGFFCHGRGFIWFVDGLEQQYMFFIQEGEWLRALLGGIISGSFEIPMWSGQIGYGADYVYSASVTLGNPINLLSVFATAESADYVLQATVPLTLFLAGLAFLWYCRYKQFDAHASIAGCFVYLFGGYSFIAYSQIYLLYPLILAPLAVRGVDRLFDGKSPLGFVVAMALAFASGVSTGYMMCLLLLVYCVVRYIFLPERKSVLGFLKWFGLIFGCIVLGALVAGVLFYPLAANILAQGRLGLERSQALLYSLTYYIAVMQGFIDQADVGADCLVGFAPIALVCVTLMFAAKDNRDDCDRMLTILFVVFTLVLLLPIAGRVTNGFAYANNRWVFGYALLVALIVAIELPKIRVASESESRKAMAIVCLYVLVCFACMLVSGGSAMVCAGFAGLAFVLALWYAAARREGLFKMGVLVSIAASCLLTSYFLGLALAENRVLIGKAQETTVELNPASLVTGLSSANEATRYDAGPGVQMWRNGNWALGLSGSTFYNSYYNSYIDEYHTSLGLATSSMNFAYSTYNSRSAMEALGGTEYFVAQEGNPTLVPPAFDEEVAEDAFSGTDFAVYATSHIAPLAYVVDDSMARSTYEGLGLVERQEALLQTVVLEEGSDDHARFVSRSRELPYSIQLEAPEGAMLDITNEAPDVDDAKAYTDGSVFGGRDTAVPETMSAKGKRETVTIADNSITTTVPHTVLYFDVDIPAGTEAYLCIEDLSYQWLSERDLMSDEEWASHSAIGKLKVLLRGLAESVPRETFLYVYGDGTRQEIWQMNGSHHLYGGKDDWAVNFGYSESERNTVAVEFVEPGVYAFGSIDIVAEDSEAVIADIDALAANTASDIVYEGNRISCTVDAARAGDLLALRIPYSAGWSATANGEAVEVLRSDVGFMAVRLPAGRSDVELAFETPHLRAGAMMTCVGIVLTAAACLVLRRRRSRRKG